VSFIAQDFTLAIQYNIASLLLSKNSLAKLHDYWNIRWLYHDNDDPQHEPTGILCRTDCQRSIAICWFVHLFPSPTMKINTKKRNFILVFRFWKPSGSRAEVFTLLWWSVAPWFASGQRRIMRDDE